jgi:hypothetical protein
MEHMPQTRLAAALSPLPPPPIAESSGLLEVLGQEGAAAEWAHMPAPAAPPKRRKSGHDWAIRRAPGRRTGAVPRLPADRRGGRCRRHRLQRPVRPPYSAQIYLCVCWCVCVVWGAYPLMKETPRPLEVWCVVWGAHPPVKETPGPLEAAARSVRNHTLISCAFLSCCPHDLPSGLPSPTWSLSGRLPSRGWLGSTPLSWTSSRRRRYCTWSRSGVAVPLQLDV